MTWFFPTYGRPELCKRAIARIIEIGCSTPGVLIINGPAAGYANFDLPPGWVARYIPENIGFCAALNWAFDQYPNEPWYGVMGDDELVETEGWDRKLIAAAGDWYIAHSNDRWQSHRRIHGYAVFGGKLVRSIGYLAPPGMWHWYIDDIWEALSSALGLKRFCRDVFTQHLHYVAGKSEKDDTYREGEKFMEQDKRIAEDWINNEFEKTVQRIKEQMMNDGVIIPPQGATDDGLQRREATISINICCNRPIPPMNYSAMMFMINYMTANAMKMKINVRMQSSNLPSARQESINAALADGSTHILFIDDDMVFPMDVAHRMLHALNELTMKGIKAGIGVNATRKSMSGLRYTAKDLEGNWLLSRGKSGLAEVSQCGLGVFMIELESIRHIPWPLFESIADYKTHEISGEDFYFTQKLRKHGIQLYIDQDMSQKIMHVGDFPYCYDTYPIDGETEKPNGPQA